MEQNFGKQQQHPTDPGGGHIGCDSQGDIPQQGEPKGSLTARYNDLRLGIFSYVICTAVIAIALLVMILAWPRSPNTPEFVPPPVPGDMPAIHETGVERQYLSDAEIDQLVIANLALMGWGEISIVLARAQDPTFLWAVLSEPNIPCAQDFRDRRLTEEEPSPGTIEEYLDCSRKAHTVTASTHHPWEEMSYDYREALLRERLERLWWTISPTTVFKTEIALRQAILINRDNSSQFADFEDHYLSCMEAGTSRAHAMSRLETADQIADEWSAAAEEMRNCANIVTEENFPIRTL